MVQCRLPDRRRWPRTSAVSNNPAKPRRQFADTGKGQGNQTDEQAERHAKADGDVAEISRSLDGVAEEGAHGRNVSPVYQQADLVAKFQNEIPAREEVTVSAR